MNINDLDLDNRILTVGVLDALRVARQVAYDNAREFPALHATYEAAEKLYQDTARAFGANVIPVFDREQRIVKRIEEGDEFYTVAYGSAPII